MAQRAAVFTLAMTMLLAGCGDSESSETGADAGAGVDAATQADAAAGADAAPGVDAGGPCGDGVVGMGETCDTGIESGPGACPEMSDCADGQACTEDNLVNGGTCQATCENPEITDTQDGDGCCPAGADAEQDDDCSATCGNGTVESGETCDTGIDSGEGTCPQEGDCDDQMACTDDVLLSAGTCQAECTNQPITQPDDGDNCCPSGANANNDDDCDPVCGNGVVEAGEECDDGNQNAGDGCDDQCQIEPTAFVVDSLALRDPHAFAEVVGCNDGTSIMNDELDGYVTQDGDDDGNIDLAIVQVFRPLDPAADSTPLDLYQADCTAPLDGDTTCSPGDGTMNTTTADNQDSGTCLSPISGTTGKYDDQGNFIEEYSPSITKPGTVCYAGDSIDSVTLDVSGMILPLKQAHIGATYDGDPTDNLVDGLMYGFITEEAADQAIIPEDVFIVGGEPLSSVLPGGEGNCADHTAMDVGPDGDPGWWLYLNFTARDVPWSEP